MKAIALLISNDAVTLELPTSSQLNWIALDSVRRCPVTNTWRSGNHGIVKRLSLKLPRTLIDWPTPTERPQQPVVSAHRAFTRFELEPSPMPEPRLENGGRVGGLCDRIALQILCKELGLANSQLSCLATASFKTLLACSWLKEWKLLSNSTLGVGRSDLIPCRGV